jgi:hypothetical protein
LAQVYKQRFKVKKRECRDPAPTIIVCVNVFLCAKSAARSSNAGPVFPGYGTQKINHVKTVIAKPSVPTEARYYLGEYVSAGRAAETVIASYFHLSAKFNEFVWCQATP